MTGGEAVQETSLLAIDARGPTLATGNSPGTSSTNRTGTETKACSNSTH
eukprot:CAMPEP_0185621518 /NCGR_PEP_ID=MMETSP0436-20130131/57668_1 /TAXON_ID=626734 ORGANISM="Favella taraikaensis, Strain Fe Narragansett Bay" /NCGR_SAMPLE_ID=MMETSP0436 /ASSEMBLY_ACC=CAM_ASM_000390 /LENGTH=48 /DNA_ID= /DNA_START= /DNA_END= /DNA_ORIENTATION=